MRNLGTRTMNACKLTLENDRLRILASGGSLTARAGSVTEGASSTEQPFHDIHVRVKISSDYCRLLEGSQSDAMVP